MSCLRCKPDLLALSLPPPPTSYCISSCSEWLIRSFCREMVGIEYVVALAQEPKLFLIHKRHRHGYDDVELLASYYVLDGSIYMCPDLYSVLSMRLASSAHFINKALEMGSQQLQYEPNEKAYKARKASIGASSARNPSETDISPSEYRLQDQVSLAFEANICL